MSSKFLLLLLVGLVHGQQCIRPTTTAAPTTTTSTTRTTTTTKTTAAPTTTSSTTAPTTSTTTTRTTTPTTTTSTTSTTIPTTTSSTTSTTTPTTTTSTTTTPITSTTTTTPTTCVPSPYNVVCATDADCTNCTASPLIFYTRCDSRLYPGLLPVKCACLTPGNVPDGLIPCCDGQVPPPGGLCGNIIENGVCMTVGSGYACAEGLTCVSDPRGNAATGSLSGGICANTTTTTTSTTSTTTTTPPICTPSPYNAVCVSDADCKNCTTPPLLFYTRCYSHYNPGLNPVRCDCLTPGNAPDGLRPCCDGQVPPAGGVCGNIIENGVCMTVGTGYACAEGLTCVSDPGGIAATGSTSGGICTPTPTTTTSTTTTTASTTTTTPTTCVPPPYNAVCATDADCTNCTTAPLLFYTKCDSRIYPNLNPVKCACLTPGNVPDGLIPCCDGQVPPPGGLCGNIIMNGVCITEGTGYACAEGLTCVSDPSGIAATGSPLGGICSTTAATTTTATITTTPASQCKVNLGANCTRDSDCSSCTSTTMHFTMPCIGGKCLCGIPSVNFTPCCDKQTPTPSTPNTCPWGLEYSVCDTTLSNSLSCANVDFLNMRYCVETPETIYKFGAGNGVGVCLSADAISYLNQPGRRKRALATFATVYRFTIGTAAHFYTNSAYEYQTLLSNPSFKYDGIAGCMPLGSEPPATVPIYRLYNTIGYGHMYAGEAEKNVLLGMTGWTLEGLLGYCSPTPQQGMSPWQRFYNTISFDHVFTYSAAEALSLSTTGKATGWVYEGIVCYIYTAV